MNILFSAHDRYVSVCFVMEVMIRGYHEYRVVWECLINGENLFYPHEAETPTTLQWTDGNLIIVGHIPQRISSICSIFEAWWYNKLYSKWVVEDRLEIPCLLTFWTSNNNKISKFRVTYAEGKLQKANKSSPSTINCAKKLSHRSILVHDGYMA